MQIAFIDRVSQKKTFAYISACGRSLQAKNTQLSAIHILTYISILVHLFQYLRELEHFM